MMKSAMRVRNPAQGAPLIRYRGAAGDPALALLQEEYCMSPSKLSLVGLALVAGLGTTACTDGYGSTGVSVGYNSGGWDPYYGGFSADPYWGWYGDYYYPGSGVYVYDRSNHRTRWSDTQRGYWQGRT
jgi:hypothetical protein